MGLSTSKLELPEDPTRRVYESFGIATLPFDYPLEVPDERSSRRIVKWWSAMQLMHPAVPYDVISRPESDELREMIGRGVSWYSRSTLFETLSPLTRLIVEMTVADMKKSPERLERLQWPTGYAATVWVHRGAHIVRIEYQPRVRKFIALYTYVHLTADLKFESYEYFANLR